MTLGLSSNNNWRASTLVAFEIWNESFKEVLSRVELGWEAQAAREKHVDEMPQMYMCRTQPFARVVGFL